VDVAIFAVSSLRMTDQLCDILACEAGDNDYSQIRLATVYKQAVLLWYPEWRPK